MIFDSFFIFLYIFYLQIKCLYAVFEPIDPDLPFLSHLIIKIFKFLLKSSRISLIGDVD